jgi:hypothetical protein
MTEPGRSAILREVNDRIAEITDAWGWEDPLGFLCECIASTCAETARLTRAEYAVVRAGASRFLTVPGHEHAEHEHVVERHAHHVVIERREAAQPVTVNDSS